MNRKDIEFILDRLIEPFDQKVTLTYVKDRNILVTGAGGSIGKELSVQILKLKPKRLILLDVSEFATYEIMRKLDKINVSKIEILPIVGSILDEDLVNTLFEQHNVHYVFHSAAYKHLGLMETNQTSAFKNNSLGTYIIAKAAIKYGVEYFTLISTDKAVEPICAMGKSKKLAEQICLALNSESKTNFKIVRFGNIFNSNGSVIPLFIEQIDEGGPVTITSPDVFRYFIVIEEAVQLVLLSMELKEETGIFMLDMGKEVNILNLAKRLINLKGFNPIFNLDNKKSNKDILIKFIGLKTNEKLHEKLSEENKYETTAHPRILKVGAERENFKIEELINEIKKLIV
ncbi:polysaccharide biosynthesis protein [Alphaproteobacteria bacterium]|nr:polysaccharide biosynthesis protein [Alphaproteobacteria bacterium]